MWRLAAIAVLVFAAIVAIGMVRSSVGPSASTLRAEVASRTAVHPTSCYVPLGRISPRLQTAVLASEDQRFFNHSGFDYGQIASAAQDDLSSGTYRRGASTITQQLARMLLDDHDKTFARKTREAILASRLEETLTKDEIFELYLNGADWGTRVSGIEAASRYYFNKSAAQLDWADAATLAVILPSPSRYDPRRNWPAVARRRNQLLDRMLAAGLVSPADWRRAATSPCCAFDNLHRGPTPGPPPFPDSH